MLIKKVIIFFLFIPVIFCFAMSEDSVLTELKGKSEADKVEMLSKLCWENRNVKPRLALNYGNIALHKIEKYELNISKSRLYNYIGVVYSHLGILDSAYHFYQQALFEATKFKDTLQLAYSINNLGDYYLQSSLYSLALEKFFKSNSLFKQLNDKTGLAYSYNDIGQVYFYQKDFDKALENYEKSLKIRKELNDYRGISKSLTGIAAVLEEQKNYTKALQTYEESEKYARISKYYKGIVYSYLGYSKIYYFTNQYDKALKYNQLALELSINIDLKPQILACYIDKAKILIKTGQIDAAKEYLTKSNKEAASSGMINLLADSYKLLKEIAVKEGNYKLALEYQDEYSALEDSIFSKSSANKIADLQSAYLVQLKESENNLLKKEIEAEKVKTRYLGIIGILVVLLLSLGISRYRLLKRLNDKLKAEVESKNKLFSIIAHDLNNPVGAITSAAAFLSTDYNEIEEADKKELVDSIADASKNIQLMISNLLNWARQQQEGIKINKKLLNIKELLENLADSYKFLAKKKSIEIVVDANDDINAFGDKFVIETILGNLITNSVKFSNKNSQIILSANVNKNNKVILEVKDFGTGISKDVIELIVNKNKPITTLGTDKEKGVGLGMQIVKELVSLHDSKLKIESEVNSGTKFIIEI